MHHHACILFCGEDSELDLSLIDCDKLVASSCA